MGAVCTSQNLPEDEAQRINDTIDKNNKEDYKKIQKDIKILLLGTGEAGKTTMMKQIQILYEGGFQDDYRMDIKPIIYKQVIKNMKILIRESQKYTEKQTFEMNSADRINLVEERILDAIEFGSQFTEQVWEDLEKLWADPSIKQTLENGYKFILDDSTEYFFDKISTLKKKDYIPTDSDILRTRIKTSAVVEKNFEYLKNNYKVIDVGGQRSERRKWAHCFPDINALIFVVAISEYDQNLREDNSTRRLDESLRVYEETINNKFFKDKPVILYLNKRDIFEEKFKKRNLNLYYPEFKGTTDVEAIEFIKSKFDALDRYKSLRETKTSIAINTDLFRTVFDAIVSQVLHESLRIAGFIKTRPNN